MNYRMIRLTIGHKVELRESGIQHGKANAEYALEMGDVDNRAYEQATKLNPHLFPQT